MNRKLIYLNFAVIAGLVIGLAYFILQNQKIVGSTTSQNESQSLESPELISEASPSASPKAITRQDTEQAILDYTNNTNRAELSKFLADTVNVTLYATDCCEPMTKEEAINQLSYINGGLPVTFDQKNTTVVNLKAKNQNLSQTYLGISQTKDHMAAYTIDPISHQITKIELSVSWKLYNQ